MTVGGMYWGQHWVRGPLARPMALLLAFYWSKQVTLNIRESVKWDAIMEIFGEQHQWLLPFTFTCCCCLVTSIVSDPVVTPCTVPHQDPLSVGFPRARILEWVSISLTRGSSDPGIKLTSLAYPALTGRFFTTEPPGKPALSFTHYFIWQICTKHLPCARHWRNNRDTTDRQYSCRPKALIVAYCLLGFPGKRGNQSADVTGVRSELSLCHVTSIWFWNNVEQQTGSR